MRRIRVRTVKSQPDPEAAARFLALLSAALERYLNAQENSDIEKAGNLVDFPAHLRLYTRDPATDPEENA